MQTPAARSWNADPIVRSSLERHLANVAFAGVIISLSGLVTSPFLLSVGTVVMILPAFVLPVKVQFSRFWAHKPAVFISLLFVLQLISGIWTRDIHFQGWLKEATVKAPLFFGFYSLAVLGPFSVKQVRMAMAVLLVTTFFVGFGTVVGYALNAEIINEEIQTSKEVKVWLGCNHIYFSIVMAFSILAGWWSLRFRDPLLFKGERILIGLLVAFNFIIMHILTTRTGLVGMYITLLVLGWAHLLSSRKYWLALLLTFALIAAPVAGYYSISSFHHRIDNTWMDLNEYFRGKDPNYLSIGTRLESWKTAINLWRNHPILGVGMPDLKADMTDQYVADQTRLCPENFVQPHNQFLQNLAGWGIVGISLSLFAWLYPVFSSRWKKGLLFWMFWITYTLAMMGESTMERQVGVAFLAICFMLSLGVPRDSKS